LAAVFGLTTRRVFALYAGFSGDGWVWSGADLGLLAGTAGAERPVGLAGGDCGGWPVSAAALIFSAAGSGAMLWLGVAVLSS
jgi:hypothetical protein